MKKIFTLISVALVAMSANAQESWNASALTEAPAEATIEAKTTNVTMKSLSSPNTDQVADGYWSIKGGTGTNVTLDDTFVSYFIGKGNPALTHEEYDEETDNGTAHRVNETYWEPGVSTLPVQGAYTEFTAASAGTLKVGVYVNKGNHNLYIIDETNTGTGYQVVNYEAISVKFCYQNNTFTYNDAGDIWYEGVMSSDYILQKSNPVAQNRPALGFVTFNVEAGKTYMMMNPKSQLGIYGFEFTAADPTAITSVASEVADAPLYNLAGQKVSKDYKGVVIQNGKKFLNK